MGLQLVGHRVAACPGCRRPTPIRVAAVLLERMRGLPLDTVVLSYQCRRCGPVPIRLQQIDPNPIRVEMTR